MLRLIFKQRLKTVSFMVEVMYLLDGQSQLGRRLHLQHQKQSSVRPRRDQGLDQGFFTSKRYEQQQKFHFYFSYNIGKGIHNLVANKLSE